MAEQNALAKYDPRQYRVIARPEDLVPLSRLVTIDLVAVDLGSCANVGQGNFMPSREKTDQIGSAAGITFRRRVVRGDEDRSLRVGRPGDGATHGARRQHADDGRGI